MSNKSAQPKRSVEKSESRLKHPDLVFEHFRDLADAGDPAAMLKIAELCGSEKTLDTSDTSKWVNNKRYNVKLWLDYGMKAIEHGVLYELYIRNRKDITDVKNLFNSARRVYNVVEDKIKRGIISEYYIQKEVEEPCYESVDYEVRYDYHIKLLNDAIDKCVASGGWRDILTSLNKKDDDYACIALKTCERAIAAKSDNLQEAFPIVLELLQRNYPPAWKLVSVTPSYQGLLAQRLV